MGQQPVNVFLAAVYTNNYMAGGSRYPHLNQTERNHVLNIKKHNILESYHYVHGQRFVNNMRDNGAEVFLDSGAFSAWTTGVTINIDDYCNYIIRNEDIIRKEDGVLMASVLDGIGDPEETLANQKYMEKAGAKPLPCFHKGEDLEYLEYYVNNYEYITIGGMVGSTPNQLRMFCDNIFSKVILDGAGRPKCKVHGFGLTSIPLMERYPWFSCDSSSWIQATSFGSVVIPGFGPLSVSSDSPSRHVDGQHLFSLKPMERYELELKMWEWGFGSERLSTCYESRAIYNLLSYMDIERNINLRKPNINPSYVQELF